MTTATATETLSHSIFLGRDSGLTPHPMPPPHGDSAPLSLEDILPNPTPTAPEDEDNWRSIGEIKGGIIKRLAIQQGSTE